MGDSLLTSRGVERLNKLAWLLDHYEEELPIVNHGIKSFDLGSWMKTRNYYAPVKNIPDGNGTLCGTTACAVGTAMFHPWFNAQGLMPDFIDGGAVPLYDNQGYHYYGWGAVGIFFGIPQEDALYLFDEDAYEGTPGKHEPSVVVKRIREYVKLHEPANPNKERFITKLREAQNKCIVQARKVGKHYLPWGEWAYCAQDVYFIMCGYQSDGQNYIVDGVYINTAEKTQSVLGITEEEQQSIVKWNDVDGLTFAQIADRLEYGN